MSEPKPLYINGVPMPFSSDELVRILTLMRKSMTQAGEEIESEQDQKIMDSLLDQLNSL